MVSVLAFYSDIQSSNPDEVTERTKINKKRPGLARFKNTFITQVRQLGTGNYLITKIIAMQFSVIL